MTFPNTVHSGRNPFRSPIGKTLLLGILAASLSNAYPPYPVVTGISPSSGPAAGGTLITITGTNFESTTAIQCQLFLYMGRGLFTVVNDTTITLVTPPGTGNQAFIVEGYMTGAGPGSTGYFQYLSGPAVSSISPSSGPATGGTAVTVTGSGFTGATAVTVGGLPLVNFVVVNDTTVTGTIPPGTSGPAGIVVTVGENSSPPTTSFTYQSSALQISASGPAGNMQVVQNESLVASTTASVFATQPGYTWIASTPTAWLSAAPSSGSFPPTFR